MVRNKHSWTAAGVVLLVTAVTCGDAYAQRTGGTTPKRPFQKTIVASIVEGGNSVEADLAIPNDKMLVIESANARLVGAAGLFASISFTAWFDDNGNGQADASDESIHDVPMSYQVYAEVEGGPPFIILSGHEKVLVFAAGRIGATAKGIKMSVRTPFAALVPTEGILTISGYLEDLPQP